MDNVTHRRKSKFTGFSRENTKCQKNDHTNVKVTVLFQNTKYDTCHRTINVDHRTFRKWITNTVSSYLEFLVYFYNLQSCIFFTAAIL